MKTTSSLLAASLLSALLAGCGGSSGDSASGSTPDANQPNNPNQNNPVVGDTSGDFAMVAQAARGSVLVNLPTAVSGADSYTVYFSDNQIAVNSPATGSTQQTCTSLPCAVTGLDNGQPLIFRIEALNGSSRVGISHQVLAAAGAINDTGEASCISTTTGSFPDGISSCDSLPTGAAMWPKDILEGMVALPAGRIPQQDGNTGRDANSQLIKVGSGVAGFDYTKLDGSGNAVAANATSHECFRDNVTGLVWQASASNSTVDYDATSGSAVPASLCGISTGWRMPTKAEAESLLHYRRTGVSVDTRVSVDTSLFATAPTNNWYWTRSPYPAALSGGVQNDSTGSAHHHWVINFTTGQRSTFDTNGNGIESQARTLYVNDTANQ